MSICKFCYAKCFVDPTIFEYLLCAVTTVNVLRLLFLPNRKQFWAGTAPHHIPSSMMEESHRESIGDGDVEGEIVEWYNHEKKNNVAEIATYLQTQTEAATHLFIDAPASKLTSDSSSDYAIGGTYNKITAELWFFCNTSMCHGNNYLLNLFVSPRREIKFSTYLSSIGHNLTDIQVNTRKQVEITGPIKEYTFTATGNNEVIHLKTYRFTKADIEKLKDMPILLSCSIRIHESYKTHQGIVKKIKLQYTVQLNEALYKTKADGDFILESATHKAHPVHLFVAAAQSPVLRNAIKKNSKTYFLNLSDEKMGVLIEFLYKGSIENLSSHYAPDILEIAVVLQLPGLLKLAEVALSANINRNNAVDIAMLAKKHILKDLSSKALQFILDNIGKLLSDNIQQFNDVGLMRDILQHLAWSDY